MIGRLKPEDFIEGVDALREDEREIRDRMIKLERENPAGARPNRLSSR